MTTPLLPALAAALWPTLVRHLKAIGRRLLSWVRRMGVVVVGWMRERIEVFKRRRERAKTAHRRRWLAGRIRRWIAASVWLEQWTGQTERDIPNRTACVVYLPELARKARDLGIPMIADAERDPSRRAA